jgi:mono/diheme cytochrome c family protein
MLMKSIPFLVLLATAAAIASAGDGPISAEEARKLTNPIPYSSKSIAEGKSTFIRMCSSCHGMDGKSAIDVVADATDLTEPKGYKSGSSSGEIFRSIRDGQGASMPSFRTQIKGDEELWHLVNFIESLWPESVRPKSQSSKPESSK